MKDNKIIDGIKECLCGHLKGHLLVDKAHLCFPTNLRQETVFDDLDWLEFQSLLEEHFRIEISDDEIDKWITLEDVYNTVWTAVTKKNETCKKNSLYQSQTRFEIITRDVDTLADFLFHITEDLPWFAREERLERIKRFLKETP